MKLRVAIATAYTLFVIGLLLTWPSWTTPPSTDNATVITATRSARWLVILIPFVWGAVWWSSKEKRTRRLGLRAGVLLFVACLLFIWYHDYFLGYAPCLWYTGCGGWFD